ncbi:tyrosine-type recombinase/integrase, partial [Acinetobacter baumannii]|nr:tyrosine-type recombinase/integrase [Acinetobacter baumannii]
RESSKILWLRDLTIIEIAYSSGLRLDELHKLEITSVDISQKLMRITGKGNKTRIVPLGTKAIEMYEQWLIERQYILDKNKDNKHNFVFITSTGKQLSRTQINERIKNAFRKIGHTEKCNPHMLRHSFATHLINATVGIRDIQEMLGHDQLNTTQIYTELDTTSLAREYLQAHPRAIKRSD